MKGEIDWKRFKKLGLLGLDEISLKKGHRDFFTLVTGRINNKTQILAVIKGREKADIKAFLLSIPKKLKRTVESVCCDMYDGYINAAKEVFNKKVPVIIDRFHVAKLYRKCLVELRKKELTRLRKTLSEEKYKTLKPAISILKRNKEFLTVEERKVLEPLFRYSSTLKIAYKFCCQLTGIYNSHFGKRKANNKINEWMLSVERSELRCFDRFIGTLKKYQPEIVAYFKGRNTSGFVEGFNNKVKVIKRRCYGIFKEKSLFRRLFLDCLGYDIFHNIQGLQPL